MWMRNLLFLGLCLVGLVALGASLAPVDPPKTHARHDLPLPPRGEGFQTTLAALDQAFQQQWTTEQLQPAARADDLAMARRLSLALTGTIPSVEELRQLENHPDPAARTTWWLEGILADDRSADYLAERLARVFVGTKDGPFIVYRRRRFVAWLADQLKANVPYDQLARSLITDSGLWTDKPATNFVTVTIKPDSEEGPNPNELAGKVARSLLGTRIDCAECHDHPFEPWKQSDFEGLAAFFGNTQIGLSGIHDDDEGKYQVEDRVTGQPRVVEPCVPYAADRLPAAGTRRERLAAWVTDKENRPFANAAVNRIWAQLFGRALVEPIDEVPLERDVPPAMRVLADDFIEHGYDLRRLIRLIAASQVFQLDSRANPAIPDHEITDAHEAAWAVFPLVRLRPEQAVGALLQSASLQTIDYDSHLMVRLLRATGQSDFVTRHGDLGPDEFTDQGSTIPQRLLLMNGELVQSKTEENIVTNAATRISALAATREQAIETAYLAVLTRRPTPEELAFILEQPDTDRSEEVRGLYWVLLNSTEFSWNH